MKDKESKIFKKGVHRIKILEIEQLTHDVKRFITEKPNNYTFTPGQATLLAVNEKGFTEKYHPFTFTSLKDRDILEFIIKGYPISKYPNHSGVTEKIHKLDIGDEFLIKEPVGTIEYRDKGVFIAGGAGITPFVAIFKDLKKKNKLEGNRLMFSNKKQRDIILEEELKELFDKKDLILTLSRENVKGYEHGRIDRELLEKYIKDFNQYFYICGPSGFEDGFTEILTSLGAQKEKIVVEEW